MPMQCMICLLKVCEQDLTLLFSKPRESRGSRIGLDRRLCMLPSYLGLRDGKAPIHMLVLQPPQIGTIVWHQRSSPRIEFRACKKLREAGVRALRKLTGRGPSECSQPKVTEVYACMRPGILQRILDLSSKIYTCECLQVLVSPVAAILSRCPVASVARRPLRSLKSPCLV